MGRITVIIYLLRIYEKSLKDIKKNKRYLTIRLWARNFYRAIVDEGEARINYRAIEIESE